MFGFFIRHPIIALMLNVAMLTIGLYAFLQLNVDSMPAINVATISVTTMLEGASPEQVELDLTKPIEDATASLALLDYISSSSAVGQSQVNINFQLGKDPNVALDEVRSKVDALINDFPVGTYRPIYGKFSTSDAPVLQLAVSGKRSLRELTELTKYQIRDSLQTVDGVGQVMISGGVDRTIQINLDQSKLRRLRIPVATISTAVSTQVAKVPGGYLTSPYTEYLVTQPGLIREARDFNNIVLDQQVDTPQDVVSDTTEFQQETIFLSDVAHVIDGEAEQRSLARLNGATTLGLSVTKSSDANLLKVSEGVRERLDELKQSLPPDVHIEVVQDNSTSIKSSVHDLLEHLVLGSLLASLTVLLFMGSFRLTLIASVAIPVSLITTFALMWTQGYTLNYMTLLALTLAVGIVVDDAVVVLENIYRLMEEEGLGPIEAAIEGVTEIGFAVLATTVSLCVLFLPLAFMPGIVGLYFRSWGVTMAFSILVSMVVSFTLTPVMCSVMVRAPKKKQEVSWLTRQSQAAYVKLLEWCLRFRWVVMLVALLCLVSVPYLMGHLGAEFTARDDQSQYNVKLKFPRGWPLERVASELRPIEADLKALPHVTKVMSTINNTDVASVSIFVGMAPYPKRAPYTQFQSMAEARKVLDRYRMVKPSVSDTGDPEFSFIIVGEDLVTLEKLTERMLAELNKTPGFVELDSSLMVASPQVTIRVDPVKCAALGVSASAATDAVNVMVGGRKIARFQEGGRSYDVRMRLQAKDRQNPQDVMQLYVSAANNAMVPLAAVAELSQDLSPSTIDRYQRKHKVELRGNLQPPFTLQQAMTAANAALKTVHAPPGYGPVTAGTGKLMRDSAIAALQAFVLAVVFMYMALACQFENLLDPFIILCTLPLSVPFALISLILTGMSLNLFSILGLFLLFGVVKKNAILQIDRTNQLMKMGKPVHDAILEANRERLRPILMTTITLVVAMLPVAFANPTGAQRAPMAMVVVGGQSLCLLLTLVVVPVFTSYVESFRELWTRWFHRKQAE